MRLGGQLWKDVDTPDGWMQTAQNLAYRTVDCPLPLEAAEDVVRAYFQATKQTESVIAEVSAWSNPLASDEAMRQIVNEVQPKPAI